MSVLAGSQKAGKNVNNTIKLPNHIMVLKKTPK